MLRLALRTLRGRPAASLGPFVALLVGAALISGCGLLLQSGLRGHVAPQRFAGVPIVVSGDQDVHAVVSVHGKRKVKSKSLAERAWIPARVAATVRAVAGVGRVQPQVEFPARLGTAGTPRALGLNWGATALGGTAVRVGRAPAGAGEIVLDAELARRDAIAVGDRVTVQTVRGPLRFRVAGIAAAGGPRAQPAIWFPEATARRLAGHPGRIAALGVWPTPGVGAARLAGAVRDALAGDGVRISTGDDRGPAEFPRAADAGVVLISLAGALTATAVLVAMLVVVGTVGLAVQRREREFSLLRAVGATPRQIRSMIGREVLLLGAVAGAPGALAGRLVGRELHRRLVASGTIAPQLALAPGPLPLLGAAVLTGATAWSAGRIAGRRVARLHPSTAIAESAVPRPGLGVGRAVAGTVLLAGAAVLTVVLRHLHTEAAATPVTYLTSLTAVAGLALLVPPVLRVAGAALAALLAASPSAPGFLAAANLRVGGRRYAPVVLPVALAVTMAGTILFTQTTLAHAAARQVSAGVRADYELTAAAPGVSVAALARVRRLPGVAAVTGVVRSTARGRDLAKYTVQGVSPAGVTRTLDLDVRAGHLEALTSGTVAISRSAAGRTGAGVGDRLRLYLGDGTPVTLTVVAVYARELGFPDLTLPEELVAAHVDDPLARVVLVSGRAGLAASLRAAVGGDGGVRVTPLAGGSAEGFGTAPGGGPSPAVRNLLLVVIVGFAAIAVVNTITMNTADRVREFRTLRLAGGTAAQVRRVVRWESGAVLLVAAAGGAAISAVTLAGFGAGLGAPSPRAPVGSCLAIVGAAALLVFVPAEIAVRAVSRRPPRGA